MKKIIFSGILGLLVLTLFIGNVSADISNSCFGGMMYGNYGYGLGIFSWIFGALIITALVLFILWMIKQLQKK